MLSVRKFTATRGQDEDEFERLYPTLAAKVTQLKNQAGPVMAEIPHDFHSSTNLLN